VLKKAVTVLGFMVWIAGLPEPRLSAESSSRQFQESEREHEWQVRRDKELNKKRQDEIRQDTEKLYQLATELKDAVDKSNEHILSLDVVKKAEEVEKLAKKVKEKMKEGVGKPITEPTPTPPRIPGLGPGSG
jgi:glutathionylspermidine synthase